MRRLLIGAALFAAVVACALAASAPRLLPTGRSIDAPSGPVAVVGTLPQGLALSADGTRLLVLESGYNPPALRILDARTLAERGVVELKGAYGIPLIDRSGDGVWVAGANADALLHVDLAKRAVDRTIDLEKGC